MMAIQAGIRIATSPAAMRFYTAVGEWAAAEVGMIAPAGAGAGLAAKYGDDILEGVGRRFNPFAGKTVDEIDQLFTGKGFIPKGPDPKAGLGGYVNPNTGRSYHIDLGGSYKKGVEYPHVDVNRARGYSGSLEKRKFPLGDKLND